MMDLEKLHAQSVQVTSEEISLLRSHVTDCMRYLREIESHNGRALLGEISGFHTKAYWITDVLKAVISRARAL